MMNKSVFATDVGQSMSGSVKIIQIPLEMKLLILDSLEWLIFSSSGRRKH